MFDRAGCELNDLACMRGLTNEEVENASKSGAMGNDNVAMVLNGSFGPTHRSDLMPETLFDAVKNVIIFIFSQLVISILLPVDLYQILREMSDQILLLCGHMLVMKPMVLLVIG